MEVVVAGRSLAVGAAVSSNLAVAAADSSLAVPVVAEEVALEYIDPVVEEWVGTHTRETELKGARKVVRAPAFVPPAERIWDLGFAPPIDQLVLG